MSDAKQWFKTRGGKLFSYFLQGLLLIAPFVVTVYTIFFVFDWLDSKVSTVFEKLFGFYYPGIGILAMVVTITFIGFFGSLVIMQPLLHLFDALLEKTPLVKDLYTSLKDFFGAFMSSKKKFNIPAIFEMGKGSGVFKLGFITQQDLSEMNIKDKVAVYTPLSYNLSGILYIVNADQVRVLEDVKAGDMMKFIVSGGVTEIDDHDHEAEIKP